MIENMETEERTERLKIKDCINTNHQPLIVWIKKVNEGEGKEGKKGQRSKEMGLDVRRQRGIQGVFRGIENGRQ